MTLEGKTCLVTGATSGIGKEIALSLSTMGAAVVLVGRNRDRCEAALQEIRAKVNDARVSYLVAELSSQASIRQLAQEYAGVYRRLDVLVNNAGIFLARRATTADGIECTLAVNHLAPFLLTALLIDMIKASSPSRIITTSSVAHRGRGSTLTTSCLRGGPIVASGHTASQSWPTSFSQKSWQGGWRVPVSLQTASTLGLCGQTSCSVTRGTTDWSGIQQDRSF